MRRTLLFVIAVPLLLVAGATSAWAQPASDSVTVTAQNRGIFLFDITDASFDFGEVDAAGNLSSTGVSGARNGGDTGAIYTASAATTWTCSSAPSRTVRVYNASTASTINWGTADRLSMQIPTTGLPAGSTSCGMVAFGTTGDGGAGTCASGALGQMIAIFTDSSIEPVITVPAFVQVACKVELNPPVVYLWKSVQDSGRVLQVVEVSCRSCENFRLEGASSNHPNIRAVVQSATQAGQPSRLIVSLVQDAPVGEFEGQVTVHTNASDVEQVIVRVIGQVLTAPARSGQQTETRLE